MKVQGLGFGLVLGALVVGCLGFLGLSGCEGTAYAQEGELACEEPAAVGVAEPVRASFAGPRLLEAKVCEGVEARAPLGCGERFTAQEDKAWVWLSVANTGEATSSVVLVWRHDGQERQRMTLEVGRSPAWRTWGYRTLRRGDVGVWSVEVQDLEGASLGEVSFEVEPKAASVPASSGL